MAASALVEASRLAADRADVAAAEEILDQSLRLAPTAAGHVVRAQIRALRGRPVDAVADAETALALGGGADALEVAGWASYWQRDFVAAEQYAEDGARLATDAALRVSCLTLAGRTRHARGDLAVAEDRFIDAIAAAEGPALAAASAWLGVLRSHQSRTAEALDLLRSATRMSGALGQLNVLLHALLFTGHAAALAGRPADALAALDHYATEVERRDVGRFRGRAENFSAWVLRSLGAREEAADLNEAALEIGVDDATIPETVLAAHLDLTEAALLRGDLDDAERRLSAAEAVDAGALVFGWRQGLKVRSHRGRLALATGRAEEALGLAEALAADTAGVPRYAVPARLLAARARAKLGEPVDLDAVAADLDTLAKVVALEAW
jgi:tetratricopeptide (TPR) repeat protein